MGNDVWRRRLALLGVLLGAALLVAGCGTGGIATSGDPTKGKALFSKNCASCHTLKAAGATGTIGPSLDAAFASARAQGMKDSTFENNVLDQIRIAACFDPNDPRRCMPRNLVTGQDAEDVATYVGQVAGNPKAQTSTGGAITATSGKDIFLTAGCQNCHTLKDAGTTGTVGPNLDDRKPTKARAIDRLTNGKNAMPSFKGTLTPAQIDAVASYVSSVAGK